MTDPKIETLAGLITSTMQALAEASRQVGLSPALSEGALQLGFAGLVAVGYAADYQDRAEGCEVQLNVVIRQDSGAIPPIPLALTGLGASLEGAVSDAAGQWAGGLLPALRAAFGHADPVEAGVQVLELATPSPGNPILWRIFAGPFQVITPDGPDAARAVIAQNEREGVFPLLADPLTMLAHAPLEQRFHWLRAAYARQASGEADGDVLFNGRQWPAGSAALQQFARPTLPAEAAFQQFMVIRREGGTGGPPAG